MTFVTKYNMTMMLLKGTMSDGSSIRFKPEGVKLRQRDQFEKYLN